MLLVRVPDQALLDRLIVGLNAAQLKSGELLRVTDRPLGNLTYHVREFRPGERPSEYYAALEDRVFAWSNSEELIRHAHGLQSTKGGLFARATSRPSATACPAARSPAFTSTPDSSPGRWRIRRSRPGRRTRRRSRC